MGATYVLSYNGEVPERPNLRLDRRREHLRGALHREVITNDCVDLFLSASVQRRRATLPGMAASESELGSRSPIVTVDDFLWFLYLYPLRILAAIAPRSLLYPIGRLSWFRARKRSQAVARRVLNAKCTGIPKDQISRIAAAFLANSAIRMLDDLVVSWPSLRRRLRCSEIHGLDHLERARSAGNGVILLTVHFCAIRIAKQHLSTIGYPILTVRDEIREGDWWGRLGRRVLAPRRIEFLNAIMGESVYVQDRGCVLKIVGRLRAGGLVNIHFDGKAGAKTVPWSFLGTRRKFSTGIFDIVRLSGCEVVPMICLGRSSALRILFGPMLDIVRNPGRDEFIRANLPAFVDTIEHQSENHPEAWEQWMSI